MAHEPEEPPIPLHMLRVRGGQHIPLAPVLRDFREAADDSPSLVQWKISAAVLLELALDALSLESVSAIEPMFAELYDQLVTLLPDLQEMATQPIPIPGPITSQAQRLYGQLEAAMNLYPELLTNPQPDLFDSALDSLRIIIREEPDLELWHKSRQPQLWYQGYTISVLSDLLDAIMANYGFTTAVEVLELWWKRTFARLAFIQENW